MSFSRSGADFFVLNFSRQRVVGAKIYFSMSVPHKNLRESE